MLAICKTILISKLREKIVGQFSKIVDYFAFVNQYCIYTFDIADDTALVADSEKLCGMVSEFGKVCKIRKLRETVGKSKVMRCSRNINVGQII